MGWGSSWVGVGVGAGVGVRGKVTRRLVLGGSVKELEARLEHARSEHGLCC